MKVKLAKSIEARCYYCDKRMTITHGGEKTKDKKPVPVYSVDHRCV